MKAKYVFTVLALIVIIVAAVSAYNDPIYTIIVLCITAAFALILLIIASAIKKDD